MLPNYLITYEEETIKIKVKQADQDEVQEQKQKAIVAYYNGLPAGLAYAGDIDGGYGVTHLWSGGLLTEYRAETVEIVRRWIRILLELATWGGHPRPTVSPLQLLHHATVGALVQAEDEEAEA